MSRRLGIIIVIVHSFALTTIVTRARTHAPRDLTNVAASQLSLAYNFLSSDFAVPFGSVLPSAACPVVLNLGVNKFTAKATTALLSQLADATRLEELFIEGAETSTAAVDALARALRSPGCSLRRLGLRKASLSKANALTLLRALGDNDTLVHLELAHNKLSDAGELLFVIITKKD